MNKWAENRYEDTMNIENTKLKEAKEKGKEKLRSFREQMCV